MANARQGKGKEQLTVPDLHAHQLKLGALDHFATTLKVQQEIS